MILFPVFSLQFRVRRGFTAEGGGEETVPAFSVSHPLSTLLPGAEAAQAHETRECWCSPCRKTDGWTEAVIDRLPLSAGHRAAGRLHACCGAGGLQRAVNSYSPCKYPSKCGGRGVSAEEILGESMRVQMSGCCHGSASMFSSESAAPPPPPRHDPRFLFVPATW